MEIQTLVNYRIRGLTWYISSLIILLILVTYKRLSSSASALWNWRLQFCTVPLCLCLCGSEKSKRMNWNKDLRLCVYLGLVPVQRVVKSTNEHIVYHYNQVAFKSFDTWKLRDWSTSPLISTRSMHFLTKLKPASLRYAVTQNKSRNERTITAWDNRPSCGIISSPLCRCSN